MRTMDRRMLMAGAALAVALLVGNGSALAAGGASGCATPNGFGQHTSEMARDHGGIAAATAHHNEMHKSDLTVGQHQQMMHSRCGDMSAM